MSNFPENSFVRLVAEDHLKDIDFEVETQAGLIEEPLSSSTDVKYIIGMTFVTGDRAVHVKMESEATAMTFPPELLDGVVPDVFRRISISGCDLMVKALEGVLEDE